MGLQVTISFDVPPLPDDDIWFANAAAWSEYWGSIDVVAEFDALVNALYVPTDFDLTLLSPVIMGDDNVQYALCTKEQLLSLLIKVNTLDASYQTLRNELKVAGLLENSQ